MKVWHVKDVLKGIINIYGKGEVVVYLLVMELVREDLDVA